MSVMPVGSSTMPLNTSSKPVDTKSANTKVDGNAQTNIKPAADMNADTGAIVSAAIQQANSADKTATTNENPQPDQNGTLVKGNVVNNNQSRAGVTFTYNFLAKTNVIQYKDSKGFVIAQAPPEQLLKTAEITGERVNPPALSAPAADNTSTNAVDNTAQANIAWAKATAAYKA